MHSQLLSILIIALALDLVYTSPDLGSVFGSLTSSKAQTARIDLKSQKLQQKLATIKHDCVTKLGMPISYVKRELMLEQNPTYQEKCLLECILKGTKFMDTANRLSTRTVGKLAGLVSNDNEFIISLATASAEACNRRVTENDKCEAAHQINQCISKEIKNHKVKLSY